MEDYIKINCLKNNGIPFLYGNKDVWPWIETVCCGIGFEIVQVDDTIVKNSNNEIIAIKLIRLKAKETNLFNALSDIIDDTKITLPWLDNRNVYASYVNYEEAKKQLRIHKLTSHIIGTCNYRLTWLQPQMVKLIRFDCAISDQLKSALKSNSNLYSVNLSFAYPWHQFWHIADVQTVDRQVLDACANYWSSSKIIDNFDLIDLLQIQIAIRGPIENQYLYNCISRIIKKKINTQSSQLNINTHLFDCNRPNVHEDTILYLIYQYGRHYKKIIWLYDCRGSSLFDNCILELNLKIQNDMYVELDMKKHNDLSERELLQRLWSAGRNYSYTIKIADYKHFTGDLFIELIKMARVEIIHINVGYRLNYLISPSNMLDYGELEGSYGESITIRLTYEPRRSLSFHNDLNNFMSFLKTSTRCDHHHKSIYLIIDGVIVDDWSIFSNLYIVSIKFENMDFNIKDLDELSKSIKMYSIIEFHDCENLNDVMLLKLTEPGVPFDRIKISGKTSITKLFFYMRADLRMCNDYEYDFANEIPVIEIDQYDQISKSKYYKVYDRIMCFDDEELLDI